MALNKLKLGTALSTQITEQNANIDTIDTFMNNIKGISYAFIEDKTVTIGDFITLVQNKWAEIPIGTSMLIFNAGGYSGGGIAYKSSENNGTVLIMPNGRTPLVVQKADGSWRTYNWGV